jgi:ParB family transcriptional regulator, chromosome partitioning protein
MSEQARRGLGRGLSALLGESFDLNKPPTQPGVPAQPSAPAPAADAPYTAPSNLAAFPPPRPVESAPQAYAPLPEPASAPSAIDGPRLAPIELIQRNPGQPRQHFDEKELEDLADSIRRHGVLQPILVRPLPGHADRFEIVAGERRWRAAQRAQLHQVPIVVRELDEQEVLEIAIIENVQRSDLNPIEEAAGYSQLMSRFGRTQQDVAEVVGKSRPHIANMLRLLTLPEAIQQMVREGKLSGGHARACVTAHDPLALARRAVSEGLNVRQIEQLATQAKDERSGVVRASTSGAGKDADTRALEASMSEKLGLTVTITSKGEGGEVKITYAKLEQLDEIARRLSNGGL